MATMTASSRLSGEDGRAVMSARGLHTVINSPPPLGGPNQAMNPVDILLGALATCGTFVAETAARELGVGIDDARVTVEADLDPAGVKDFGTEVSPAMQAFRLTLEVVGATDEEAEQFGAHFRKRCPVFTTLAKAAPIDMSVRAV